MDPGRDVHAQCHDQYKNRTMINQLQISDQIQSGNHVAECLLFVLGISMVPNPFALCLKVGLGRLTLATGTRWSTVQCAFFLHTSFAHVPTRNKI